MMIVNIFLRTLHTCVICAMSARLWADLSLCLAHMLESTFCHIAAHISTFSHIAVHIIKLLLIA